MYRFSKCFLVGLACWYVVPPTPAVHCMDRDQIIYQMNVLLTNPGWKTLNVSVKDPARDVVIDSNVLLESVEPGLPPVTAKNVHTKLWLMSLVMSCKYAEVVWWYVEAVKLILVEHQKKITPSLTKWHYFGSTMLTIKNIHELLSYMSSAIKYVNGMDVTLTVRKFERELTTLIEDMENVYNNHKFYLNPIPVEMMKPDLLSSLYESFKVEFVIFSLSMIEFLDEFCNVQYVPNKNNFEIFYTQSQPAFKHPMDLCEFLSAVLDHKIEENKTFYYTDLGFENAAGEKPKMEEGGKEDEKMEEGEEEEKREGENNLSNIV